MAEIAFENGRISNFEGLMTLTWIGSYTHTAYHHASLVDLYPHAKFHWNRRNFIRSTLSNCQPKNILQHKMNPENKATSGRLLQRPAWKLNGPILDRIHIDR